jgi:hypothetical protein
MFEQRTSKRSGTIGRIGLLGGLGSLDSFTLKARESRILALFPLLAAGIPPAWIVVIQARYALNVPFYETWGLVRLLAKAFEGQLRFKHLWQLNYANRPVLPRMVMIAVAWATDMNLRYGIASNFIVALGVFAVLVLLIRQTVRPLASAQAAWMILAASLIVFSSAHGINWFKVEAITTFISVLAATLTVYALARWGQRSPGPELAILGAVAGTLSNSAGLILLGIVPVGLLLAPRHRSGPKHLVSPAVASLVAAVLVSFYFVGFSRSLARANPTYILHHTLSLAHYVLVYIGAPLGFHSLWAATLWGAVGMMTFAWCGVWLWRCSPAHRQPLLPWFLLALYAILQGSMTGLGRLYGRSVKQALLARYVTYSSLFWVSLVVIGTLAVGHFLSRSTILRTRKLAALLVAASFVFLGAVSYGKSWTTGMVGIKNKHTRFARGGECLLYYERAPERCLDLLGKSIRVRRLASQMQRFAIGPFAPSQREWFSPLYVRAAGLESERVGRIDQVTTQGATASRFRDQDDLILSGWAIDPVTRGLPAAVLIVVDGKLVGRAESGLRRADVGKALGQGALLRSGWRFPLGSFMEGQEPNLVEVYALLKDHRRIVKLSGSREIER